MDHKFPGLTIDQYTYDLPAGRIASFPLENREDSKLLVFQKGTIGEDQFKGIGRFLPGNAMLVFNNTRVIHARLRFQRTTGANIEILCLEPAAHGVPEQVFRSHEPVVWNCIVGNLRKWKEPTLKMQVTIDGDIVELAATKREVLQDAVTVEFSWNDYRHSFAAVLEKAGELPIPPYLNRDTAPIDELRYNTVYAEQEGSVAAPTAGLHFTPEILVDLKRSGIAMEKVTLHVGAGTFKPVKPGLVEDHEMHEERFVVTRSFLENLLTHLKNGNPVVPVGTTAMRTLESLFWLGVQLIEKMDINEVPLVSQWEPYQHRENLPSPAVAIETLINYLKSKNREELTGYTKIIIVPGYSFRIINGLITNFHQPGSTLLLLIAALVGDDWKKIYDYAMQHEFRFLSYGDSSLLLP